MSGWQEQWKGVTAFQMCRKIANNFPTVIMLNMRRQFELVSAPLHLVAETLQGQPKNHGYELTY